MKSYRAGLNFNLEFWLPRQGLSPLSSSRLTPDEDMSTWVGFAVPAAVS